MRRLLLLATLCSLLIGCPGGRRGPVSAGAYPQVDALMHLGEKVKVVRGESATGQATLKITNTRTSSAKSVDVDFAGNLSFDYELTKTSVPDVNADLTIVDKYRVEVAYLPGTGSQDSSSLSTSEFGLVLDNEAVRIPLVRIPVFVKGGPPGVSDPWPKAGFEKTRLDQKAAEIATEWGAQGFEISSAKVDRSKLTEAGLTNWEKRGELPDVEIWRYEIKGKFPKYAVPAQFRPNGRDSVLSPSRIWAFFPEISNPIMIWLTVPDGN